MKKNTMMRVASALLVAVLLTTCAISGTFAKYVTSATSEDEARVAYWGWKDTSLNIKDLFKNAYDGTVSSTADVIAPGTKNSVDFTFAYAANTSEGVNAPEVDYTFDVNAEITGDYTALDNNKNFTWTLKDAAGVEKSYQTVAALLAAIKALDGNDAGAATIKAGDLPAMANATCTIGWNWEFHTSADADKEDTTMGNAEDLADVKIVITVTATQVD